MSFSDQLLAPTPADFQHRDIRSSLWETYGPVMDARAVCKVLHYPSSYALQEARRRCKLPFKVLAIEGRPGIFALTDEIADALIRAKHRTSEHGPGRSPADPSAENQSDDERPL